uniref:hypothetical protein n=1 Tax=Thomasclavelia spiroformis TaxID=29348 RepID=UPI00359C7E07
LDAKVQEANTIIDEKVKTATEQAQKAKEEANRATQATDGKLDKNLGAENSDKVLITDAEGNVITQNKEDFEGGGTGNYNDLENKPQINGVELTGNKTSSDLKMYTQEEVDYLLADKMDKPYVPIEITDNATITDALEGNFKIDKIKGNTYQKVETDILPTPSRPVPINSRKVKAGDEYVELRSLKESKNLFDKNLLVANSADTQKDSFYLSIKDKETYTISCSKNDVECILGVRATKKSDGSDSEIMLLRGTTEQGSFTVDYATYENYIVRVYSTAYNIIDTIQLEQGSVATAYAPPTIRDYKIVDHANKKAKIIRNIKNVRVTPELVANKFNDYTETMKRAIIYTRDRFVIDNVTKAGNDLSNMVITKYGALINGNVFSDVSGIANMYWYPDISMLGLNGSETKDVASQKLVEFLTSNEMYVQYRLATPVEETITYVETDTSEVGYSWQDTTSPSPTVKSEVQGVEEINILKKGKNILNETLAKDYTNYINLGNGYSKFVVNVKPNTKYTVSRKDNKGAKLNNYMYVQGTQTMWMIHTNSSNVNVQQVTLTSTENGTLKVTFAGINQTKLNEVWDILGYLQIEQGDTATAYEPYTGQHINITLPQPLYKNDIANVESENYEYNDITYVLDDKTPKTIYFGTTKEKTQVFQLSVSDIFNNNDIWCDKLKNDSGKDEELFTCSVGNIYIGIDKNRLETIDVAGFKKWLKDNPLTFSGSSSTPTTQPIPEEDLKLLKTLRTNAGVNNVFINGEVKPTINARYPQDVVSAVNKLQTKLLTLQEEVVKNV